MPMTKKLLFLGGSYFQLPAIIRAKELGYYVITADYLPSNPGHKFSDEYHNVSTTNPEKILELAKKLNVDGVIAYASDPAAITAAYVSDQLDLPGSPIESIQILGKKQLWNQFLKENDFYVPGFTSGSSPEDLDISGLNFPLVVKPVDSSGSKGVSKIEHPAQLPAAFEYARSFSIGKKVIVEEFIEMNGYLIGGDGFFGTNRLEFVCYGDVYANTELNPLVPSGFSIPTRLDESVCKKIDKEINRLFNLLKVKNLSFNLEVMIDKQNKIYLKEMGPRNGGYFVPQLIEHYTNVSLMDFALKSSMENDFQINPDKIPSVTNNGIFYGFHVVHSEKKGLFKNIEFHLPSGISILEKHFFVKEGDEVDIFTGSNRAMGVVIFKFEDYSVMDDFYKNIKKYIIIRYLE